jgi:threonine/homoserine/homoserine lactone efflux protein
MTWELLSALAVFALVTSITPGPNNLMLMASGANFGFRRTLPHMMGIGLGFMLMIVLVGLGLIQVFAAYPTFHTALKVVSICYLAWLAWKIANASAPDGVRPGARPLSFLQAAGFQWVNPKGWTMALSAIAAYAPGQSPAGVAWVAGAFGLAAIPMVCGWTVLGQQMRRFLTNPARLRAFNWTMAALLLASLIPVLSV